MSTGELKQKFKELKAKKEYSPVKPTIFLTQLSTLDFAKIQDNIDEFPGLLYSGQNNACLYGSGSCECHWLC